MNIESDCDLLLDAAKDAEAQFVRLQDASLTLRRETQEISCRLLQLVKYSERVARLAKQLKAGQACDGPESQSGPAEGSGED